MAEISSSQTHSATLLTDYTPYSHDVESVELDFNLHPTATVVRSRIVFHACDGADAIALDGEQLKVLELRIDGKPLTEAEYTYKEGKLIIGGLPQKFEFQAEVEIDPKNNTALEGLYMSAGRFCTQCESESFRRITFYPDRPDVLSTFKVRILARKSDYPLLLSNGDMIESGDIGGDQHYSVWNDPHPKPAYLFALVAGVFDTLKDHFTTKSGRSVELFIHVDPGDLSRAEFAMSALKASMRWDEDKFEREYDLGAFHIVAVRDFNYGAMENKGLNIFNSSLLLADPHVSSDADFSGVERVIAHEYFHNWTGNRITLRDWFQLCLKEGLTVYRDQEFSSDMNSRPVQRIKDVLHLREVQFPEDAGPLAHPPRPDHYESITNFYTPTVYRKGAEVVRVLRSLIGEQAFSEGMQIYFERCDGKAVTLEDFVGCFEEASGVALNDFFRWYTQAGTPTVSVERMFDSETDEMALIVRQETRPGRGKSNEHPVPIPLKIGFIDQNGQPIMARYADGNEGESEHSIVLRNNSERLTFKGVKPGAIPAVLRGFEAPVKVVDDLSLEDQLIQAAHDSDPFTRWDAGQSAFSRLILNGGDDKDAVSLATVALSREIERADEDPAFSARAISLPTLSLLMQGVSNCDPEELFQARERVYREFANALAERLTEVLEKPAPLGDDLSGHAQGSRAFRGVCLSYLARLGEEHVETVCNAYKTAQNMTERKDALSAILISGAPQIDETLENFFQIYENEPLALDKWFALQASCAHIDAIKSIEILTTHKKFTWANPNRVRSLLGSFGLGNPRHFHRTDGAGYRLIIDAVRRLDKSNPMTAARLIRAFEACGALDVHRRHLIRNSLTELQAVVGLSKNVSEMIHRMIR